MAHLHEVRDTDTHFVIDPTTRKITNNSLKSVLMRGDHNSEIFTFEIPKLIEAHDMSACNRVEIHYNNISSDKTESSRDFHKVIDIQASEEEPETLVFSWPIHGNATMYAGNLSFRIRFGCVDESGVWLYKWHTEVFSGITISDGFDNTEAVIEEYADAIAAWEADLDSAEERLLAAEVNATDALMLATSANATAEKAKTIAKGRATGYVFDTYDDMQGWLWGTEDGDLDNESAEHRAMLNLGDNLYIRDKGVPDYWWDGKKERELETQKVDLTEYVKNTDYAANGDAGIVSIPSVDLGVYGIAKHPKQNVFPGGIIVKMASNSDIDRRSQTYKPIVPNNLDYAVHSVLGKHPLFEEYYTGDIYEDGQAAAYGEGDYIGQIRLQGGNRDHPKRVWMYIGIDTDDPETGIPVWLDLLSGETWAPW